MVVAVGKGLIGDETEDLSDRLVAKAALLLLLLLLLLDGSLLNSRASVRGRGTAVAPGCCDVGVREK